GQMALTGTQAVDRATSLLIAILNSSKPPLLSELSRQLGLPKSTTSRMLGALERQGLIRRDRDGAYLGGDVLMRFASTQNQDSTLVNKMRPVLESLAAKTSESVNLAVPGNNELKLIDQVDGQYLLGATNWVGRHVPYHASALGKVLLAFGAAQIPTGTLQSKTNRTITSRAVLSKELDKVRKLGFAIIDSELEDGLVAVAAPVYGPTGLVVAAISISGPDARITKEQLNKFGELIVKELKKHNVSSKLTGKAGAA
ncbi:MAG: IclR family transcriptional regulator, partial [Candidatus Nanopelagicaceae bacterium]